MGKSTSLAVYLYSLFVFAALMASIFYIIIQARAKIFRVSPCPGSFVILVVLFIISIIVDVDAFFI